MRKPILSALAIGSASLVAAAAHAQIAPGEYVGSVQYQNICSNGGQGSSATPARLTVSSGEALSYLFTIVYAAGVTQGGDPIPQGGYAITKVDTDGSWSAKNVLYGGGYNGYSTQAGTWTQTFTTNGNVVTATGTFDIVVKGTVVCSEPTTASFILAPKGY
jgi:hypothetical protein